MHGLVALWWSLWPAEKQNNQLINISNILLVHKENAKHCKSEYNLMIPAKTTHS